MDEQKQKVGTPMQPMHITVNSWDEEFKKLEENIRNDAAFEGKWQGFLDGNKLMFPPEITHLFASGGVISFGLDDGVLFLFGRKHWRRYQMLLAKEVGLSPVNNDIARHIYSSMQRFDRLNDDNSVVLTDELIRFAKLTDKVAIIGMAYHAELHDKQAYISNDTVENRRNLLARFRKVRNN